MLTTVTLSRRIAAELIGTMLLLAIVVGSGIMAARLAAGNEAIALIANTLATGAGLIVLIHTFGPVSGAHFNPLVTLTMAWHRAISRRGASCYILAQAGGAVLGVFLAHLMFAEPLFQLSTKARDGASQGLSEMVATFGLIGCILTTGRTRPDVTPVAVGLYIASAYWFTASTSFANPAVTIARSLSDSFAGIAPASVPMFLAGQAAGMVIAVAVFGWMLGKETVNGA